jgi:hypothetical protein
MWSHASRENSFLALEIPGKLYRPRYSWRDGYYARGEHASIVGELGMGYAVVYDHLAMPIMF